MRQIRSPVVFACAAFAAMALTARASEGAAPVADAPADRLRAEGLPDRAEAALALIEKGAEAREAYPALIEALTGDEALDYVVAAHALYVEPRPAEDAELLARGLTLETKARAPAAWELSRIGPSGFKAIPALIEALNSEDKHPRNFATVAVGAMGPEAREAVPALIAVLRDAGSAEPPQMNYKYPRAGAAFALGMIGPEARAAIPALREILEERNEQEGSAASWEYHRAAACFALGRIGPETGEARAAITQALEDKSAVVRAYAAAALETMEARARPVGKLEVSSLVRSLEERSGWTRPGFVAGMRALGEFAGSAAPVRKGSKRAAPPVHESIALALGYLATLDPPTPEEIAGQGEQLSDSARLYVMALGGVQQGIAPTLLESVKECEKDPRVAAARNLGVLGPEAREAVPALRKALRDGNWLLRLEAFGALRRIDRSFFMPSQTSERKQEP